MKHRPLGCTGSSVSELCLSTNRFGWEVGRAASCSILNRFVELGGNYIQAARSCNPAGGGLLATEMAERYVGDWLAESPGLRDRLFLSTRLSFSSDTYDDDARFSRLVTHCEESLRRLQVDYLDMLLLEWSPSLLPTKAWLMAVSQLIESGKVRHVACSGFPIWRLMEAYSSMERGRNEAFSAVQATFSPLSPQGLRSEISLFCRETGLPLIARAPIFGSYPWLPPHGSLPIADTFPHAHPEGAGVLPGLARDLGVTAAEVAVAWTLACSSTASVLIGVTTPNQLDRWAIASESRLPDSILARLDSADTRSGFAAFPRCTARPE